MPPAGAVGAVERAGELTEGGNVSRVWDTGRNEVCHRARGSKPLTTLCLMNVGRPVTSEASVIKPVFVGLETAQTSVFWATLRLNVTSWFGKVADLISWASSKAPWQAKWEESRYLLLLSRKKWNQENPTVKELYEVRPRHPMSKDKQV